MITTFGFNELLMIKCWEFTQLHAWLMFCKHLHNSNWIITAYEIKYFVLFSKSNFMIFKKNFFYTLHWFKIGVLLVLYCLLWCNDYNMDLFLEIIQEGLSSGELDYFTGLIFLVVQTQNLWHSKHFTMNWNSLFPFTVGFALCVWNNRQFCVGNCDGYSASSLCSFLIPHFLLCSICFFFLSFFKHFICLQCQLGLIHFHNMVKSGICRI